MGGEGREVHTNGSRGGVGGQAEGGLSDLGAEQAWAGIKICPNPKKLIAMIPFVAV